MSKQKTIILDSSVWVSYLFKDDVNHARAVEVLESLPFSAKLLIPEIVFYEIIVVLARLNQLVLFSKIQYFDLKMVRMNPLNFLLLIIEFKALINAKTQDVLIIMSCLFYNVDELFTFDKNQYRNYLILQHGGEYKEKKDS